MNPDHIGRASSLWRSLSPRNPHHLLIAAGAGLVALAVLIGRVRGEGDVLESLGPAASAGVTVFLAWAIGREIDPDHPASALFAGALAALLLAGGIATPAAVLGVLVALRIVIRSTGPPPTTLDLVALPVLAGALAWQPGGWLGGLALAAALVWDTRLPDPAAGRSYGVAAVTAGAALAVAAGRQILGPAFETPTSLGWAAVGGALLAFAVMPKYRPESRQDHRRSLISYPRLQAGRLLALGSGVAAFIWYGGGAARLFTGVWAALIAVAVHGRLVRSSR